MTPTCPTSAPSAPPSGAFGTPERRLVFDINDFDETLPGPFEWDVKRLAASLESAGRDRRFDRATREGIVRACVSDYRAAMAGFARQTNLDVFYAGLDVDATLARYRASLSKKQARRAAKNVAKMRTRDSMHALERLTHVVDGEPRIISDPPLVVPASELFPPDVADGFSDWFREHLRDYRRTLATDRRRLLERYRFVEAAQKVVGVGSVGTRAWVALFMGRDERDPLFLQLKEAQPSVLEGFAGRSEYRNTGAGDMAATLGAPAERTLNRGVQRPFSAGSRWARAKQVTHPGIEPRGFSDQVVERSDKDIAETVQRAINSGKTY